MPAVPNALGAVAPITEWQDRFDYLLPARPFLRTTEVAKALGVTDTSVNNAFEAGRICGHQFNFRGEGERLAKRIPRDAAILYLASTANYTPAERLARISEILATMHPRELVLLIQQANAALRRAQG